MKSEISVGSVVVHTDFPPISGIVRVIEPTYDSNKYRLGVEDFNTEKIFYDYIGFWSLYGSENTDVCYSPEGYIYGTFQEIH